MNKKMFYVMLFFASSIMASCTSEDRQCALNVTVSPQDGGFVCGPYLNGQSYFDPFMDREGWLTSISSVVSPDFCGIYAIPTENSYFEKWTGSITSKENPLHIDVQSDMTLIANFVTFSEVKLSQKGKGTIEKKKCYDEERAMMSVELTAVPDGLYEFKGWTGDVESSDNPLIIELTPGNDSDKYITAVFSAFKTESEAPKVKYSFSPREIDVTTSSQEVTITAHITDESGVRESPVAHIRKLKGYSTSQWVSLKRISGNEKDGVYSSSITIEQGAEAGDREVYIDSVEDVLGNKSISIYMSIDARKLTVINNIDEYDGPKIESFIFSPQDVDVTSSSQVVTFTAHVTDVSGVGEIPVIYIKKGRDNSKEESAGDNSTQQSVALKRISGDEKDGTYSVSITIPQGSKSGDWEVYSAPFYDIYRNSSVNPVYPTSEKKKLTVVNSSK